MSAFHLESLALTEPRDVLAGELTQAQRDFFQSRLGHPVATIGDVQAAAAFLADEGTPDETPTKKPSRR